MLVILALDTIWASSIGRPCGSVRCSSSVVHPIARGGCSICNCMMTGAAVRTRAAQISAPRQEHTNRHQKKGRTCMTLPPGCERPSLEGCYGRGVVDVGDGSVASC